MRPRGDRPLMPHAHTAGAAHRKRLAAVFALSIAIFVVELAGGLVSNSLALLADAAHLFADVTGVVDVHDLHAWTITSGMNVVSAHVITQPDADSVAVLDHLCQCLTGVFDIEHSTFQLEKADRRPREEVSHA